MTSNESNLNNAPMNNQPDAADASVHANLSRLMPTMEIPGAVSEEQLDRWTAPAAIPIASRPVVRSRFKRLVPLASAAALALAAGAAMIWHSSASTVQAATILRSLRENTFSGLRVVVSNMKAEGIEVNLEARMHFDREMTAVELFNLEGNHAQPQLSSMYALATVKGDATSQAPGLDATAEVAFSPEADWVYTKINQMPEIAELRGNPMANFVTAAAQRGVLLDLGKDSLRQGNTLLGIPALGQMNDDGDDQFEPGDLPPMIREQIEKDIAKSVVGDDGDPENLTPEQKAEVERRMKAMFEGINEGHTQGAGADAFANARRRGAELRAGASVENGTVTIHAGASAPAGGQLHEEQVMQRMMPLLQGTGGGAAVDQFAQMLRGDSSVFSSVTVTNQGNGSYLLVSTLAPDAENHTATITMSYTENVGLQYVEITNFSGMPTGAKVRVEMFSGAIPAEMFDRSRVITPQTWVIDQNFLNMFR